MRERNKKQTLLGVFVKRAAAQGSVYIEASVVLKSLRQDDDLCFGSIRVRFEQSDGRSESVHCVPQSRNFTRIAVAGRHDFNHFANENREFVI
jgi:hypothetical protein